MVERQQSGGDNEGVRQDVEGEGDEGRRAAEHTPPIGDESVPGQTQHDAPDDDVGVPPDDEMEAPTG